MINSFDFEKMGIYDLRNYARSIGVISPTKLKRAELIEKITAIINGEMPEQKKTNKGRPPIHRAKDNDALNFILPTHLFEKDNPRYKPYTENSIHLKLDALSLRENSNPVTENLYFNGYYMPYDDNLGFALKKGFLSTYSKENCIILKNMVKQYNLKLGDYVEGVSHYLEDKNALIATEIQTINGQIAKKHAEIERVDFLDAQPKNPSKKFDFQDKSRFIDFNIIDKVCPIAKGSRVAINFQDENNINEYVVELLNAFKSNNAKVFLFSIDDIPEDIYNLMENCKDVNFATYSHFMDRKQYIEMAKLKIENCLRLLEDGQDVVMVCYNSENIKRCITSYALMEKNLSAPASEMYAKNKLNDLFCLARSLEQGSLTTVLINEKDENITNIASVTLNFNSTAYSQTDIKLNLFNSNSRSLKNVSTEQDYKKIENFKANLNQDNVLECLTTLFNK